jgi:hypothetical protein
MRKLRSSLLFLLAVTACEDDRLTARSGEARVDPASIDFGEVFIGSSAVRPVTVENVGTYVLRVQNVRLSQPEAFVVAQSLPETIEAGAKATIAIQFAPPNDGPWEATLTIQVDDEIGTHEVIVTGVGVTPPEPPPACQLSLSRSSIQYPSVQLGGSAEESVVVSNMSLGECAITRLEITGAGAPDFMLLAANPGALAPGASATIGVRFTRSMTADQPAFLEIESNDAATPVHRVPLLVGDVQPCFSVMPTAIHFGVTSGTATRDVMLTACSDRDVAVTALDFTTANAEISIVSPPALPMTISAGNSRAITIQYAPQDQTQDLAELTVRSDDPLVPDVEIEITGSPDIVPEDVGRFLYFWQVDSQSMSNIVRIPLQGGGAAANYWGQTPGQTAGCPGCHQVSRDGRYVAVIEINLATTLYMVDTMTNTKVTVPFNLLLASSVAFRPDVNSNPPYQFVAGINGDLRLGSVTGGFLGDLAGGADPNLYEAMPAWGPDGEIVFVRGQGDPLTPGFGFTGPTDLVVVPEAGGTATPLAGASGNGWGNYYPSYSPNGRWISFTQSRAGQMTYAAPDAQVRLVAADGSGTTFDLPTINGPDGATSFPTWSRDGSYLSISSNRAGGVGDWDIYIAPIDQNTGMELGPPTNLTTANTAGFEHAAQWSP